MAEHGSKPRAIPSMIAAWTALIFVTFIISPNAGAIHAQRVTAPSFASYMAILIFIVLIGTIWAAVGTARLHTIPVRITMAVLIGYPLLVVAKALITGYFSWWMFRFIVFMMLMNGLCTWYLLRPHVRVFWSPGAPSGSA